MARRLTTVLTVAVLFVLVFVVTPLRCEGGSTEIEELPPSFAHPFGTDDLGRDVFSLTLEAGFEGVTRALFVGALSCIVAVFSAFFGEMFESLGNVLNSIAKGILSIPAVFISLIVLGIQIENLDLRERAFVILSLFVVWSVCFNTIGGRFKSVMSSEYVRASKALGVKWPVLLFSHVVPNSLEVILEGFFGALALVVSLEATVGFLGIGIPNSLGELIRIHFLRSIGYVGMRELSIALLGPFLAVLGNYSASLTFHLIRWRGINLWSFLLPLGYLVDVLLFIKVISKLSVDLVKRVYYR